AGRPQVRNPILPKIRHGLLHVKSYVVGQTSSRLCGAEVWKGGCQLKCLPCHLTEVQNLEEAKRPSAGVVLYKPPRLSLPYWVQGIKESEGKRTDQQQQQDASPIRIY
ncbi:hypothetical protein AVEN_215875-1, partial [Araneus ventricosus]